MFRSQESVCIFSNASSVAPDALFMASRFAVNPSIPSPAMASAAFPASALPKSSFRLTPFSSAYWRHASSTSPRLIPSAMHSLNDFPSFSFTIFPTSEPESPSSLIIPERYVVDSAVAMPLAVVVAYAAARFSRLTP